MTWTPQAAQFVGGFAPKPQENNPAQHTENPAHGPIPRIPGKGTTSEVEGVAGKAAGAGEAAEGAGMVARLAPLLAL